MSRVGELLLPPLALPPKKTARELIEQWTPGILSECDGSELSELLAVEATMMLIENGAIPPDPETQAFTKWFNEKWRNR